MSAELVVVAPLLLLLLLSAVQAGVWWHGVHIAESIAVHAIAAVRVDDGTPAAGQAAGERVRTQLAGQLLRNVRIDITRNAESARVEITATAMQVVPGLDLPIQVAATGATEPNR
ncbi:TadE/TadG family type IV pilus assembly protein [Pseudonocardia sp. TRM90224]|uniref:TadE/TadG family type IV pilus assembly protein n=1 Tax=Pseudonocardia sp. TRM90224 TaxID=2812678 RepID=UPI001E5952E9|nr:TadE/TadG family type IV pilus assembly protein [Pseudonocardia sp. TRM90224]